MIKVKKLAILLLFSLILLQSKLTVPNHILCEKQAIIPFSKELDQITLPNDPKKKLQIAWTSMYAAYLAKNASTSQNSSEWQALKQNIFINNPFCNYTPLGQNPKQIQDLQICLDTPKQNQNEKIIDCQTNIKNAYQALTLNYLSYLQTYLNASLPRLKNDSDGIRYNYATKHLSKAIERLAATCSITLEKENPTLHFSGDIKDLGIIISALNNSSKTFKICQQAEYKNPIARIEKGINELDLYTAALYQHQLSNNAPQPIFAFFQIQPNGASATVPIFVIGIYSGQELVHFLKTLPRKNPKIFEMNGCPTSQEFLTKPDDFYLVLIQNPTAATKKERNIDQRIQAINLSMLSGPYLLTLQINEKEIVQNSSVTKVLQPSITTVQIIQTPSNQLSSQATNFEKNLTNQTPQLIKPNSSQEIIPTANPLFPLLILPQFLWEIPTIQLYWNLYATAYLAAFTDFSIFGPSTFANAFAYYNALGYFSTHYEYRFIIDKYNMLQSGQILYDSNDLIGSTLYESASNACNDIPSFYASENSRNNIVGNNNAASYLNFKIALEPQSTSLPTNDFFNKNGFHETYTLPYHQLYTLFFSIPISDAKDAFFIKIEKINNNYIFTISNKENKIVQSQSLSIDFLIKKIKFDFLTNAKDWHGCVLDYQDNQQQSNTSIEYKCTYTHKTLTATPASPIDKMMFIHTIEFLQYPITELYYDLFNVFNVAPFTRCFIIQNGILPQALQKLSIQDWQDGIYLIPSIKNNDYLNEKNPGALTITFYKANGKSILGTTTTSGYFNNSATQGIFEPIKIYNLHSKQFNPVHNAFLSSGMFLKYINKN
ncbi:hypothetical protein HYV11_01075 [Candidatus Dependentiae bacterium]|nr:hypothetical protein [Candidatus Dependentiae bacterium]